MNSLAARLAALGLALAVASCALTRPAPVKRTYLLEPPLPAAAATTKPVALRVEGVKVAAPFRDRGFVVRTAELKFETDFYHEFFVPPAAMIGDATAAALTRSGVFTRVLPPGTAPDAGDFVLEAFVTALYADVRPPAAAELAVTFYLSRAAYPRSVVWSREYKERTGVSDTSPEALAAAWYQALGAVLANLARDLAALDLPK